MLGFHSQSNPQAATLWTLGALGPKTVRDLDPRWQRFWAQTLGVRVEYLSVRVQRSLGINKNEAIIVVFLGCVIPSYIL